MTIKPIDSYLEVAGMRGLEVDLAADGLRLVDGGRVQCDAEIADGRQTRGRDKGNDDADGR